LKSRLTGWRSAPAATPARPAALGSESGLPNISSNVGFQTYLILRKRTALFIDIVTFPSVVNYEIQLAGDFYVKFSM
jgi:hypothetical protein